MIMIIVVIIILISAVIINLQMKVESLQATNDNCHYHIALLESMIRDMENKLQEMGNNNETI